MTSPIESSGPVARRLGNGELRRMVARVLSDNPGTDYTPRDIAKLIGHSSGAIGNALKTLTAATQTDQTSTVPRRYRANTRTGAVAATAPAPPPKPTAARSASPEPSRDAARVRKAATTRTPAGSGTAVERPNGQLYHLRQLAGRSDVEVLRTMRERDVPVLLYGPPGTGKTSLIEAAFGDLLAVQGDADCTVADFVGEYTQNPDGTFTFLPGPLPRAMREGRVLFVDDATLISPTVLSCIYPAMDGRREIIIKANGGEVVQAEPGFFVVAGHNPGVHGAILSDALASRFAFQVQVSSDYDLAAGLGVNPKAVKVARNLAVCQGNGEIGWAPQLRELIAFQKIAEALGIAAAAANLVGTAPEDDRPFVASVVRAVFGTAYEPLALGPRI